MKKIKRVLAWILVLIVAYVTIYAYSNPDELVYREQTSLYYTDDINQDVPLEPLVKKNNPFVYFILEYQIYLLIAGVIYCVSDRRGNQRILKKTRSFIKRFIKNKDKD